MKSKANNKYNKIDSKNIYLMFKTTKNKIFTISSSIRERFFNLKKIVILIQNKPFTSLFAILGIFLFLMILGNFFFGVKPVDDKSGEVVKKVNTYELNGSANVSALGQVEKSGVIKIIAQMPGIVQSINFTEGQNVYRGNPIVSLSSNYQGGNALSVSRQISQTQYENTKNNYETQSSIIGQQKDLANKSNDNTKALQDIAVQSQSDTKALADLNNTIVNSLVQNIQTLESTNTNGVNDQQILQAKQQLSQFQAAQAQTNSALRNLTLQTQTNSISSQLPEISHDIAVKQLDLQKKALDMSLEISRLSYNLALITESNMYPASPVEGVIDRIFVNVGDYINPGAVIANISSVNQHARIIVNVPEETAKSISLIKPSTLDINNKFIKSTPLYVSLNATNGNLYTIIFDLDDSIGQSLTDGDFINVQIPVEADSITNLKTFIPLDSVLQTQEDAYVFIVDKNNTAKSQKITLGQIQGKFVEVLSGLSKNSKIILDRNITDGEKIKIEK